MNSCQKYFSATVLALATQAAFAVDAPRLGAAAAFEVLGGTNVTCTAGSVVAGDVGVSPGSAVPFTNTGCTFAGLTPPATNAAAARARAAFLSAYAALPSLGCPSVKSGSLSGENIAPGVYCVDAVAKAGTLTLTGPANGVWIFIVGGALTGTNFNVVMAGGGQPCNVYWAPTAGVTMTDSAFKGNILAGDSTLGSITLTRGSLAGRALASGALTMTGTSVIGCGVLSSGSGSGSDSSSCKGDDRDGDDGDKDHKKSGNPFGKNDDDKKGDKGGRK
jgi:hypothetical protein